MLFQRHKFSRTRSTFPRVPLSLIYSHVGVTYFSIYKKPSQEILWANKYHRSECFIWGSPGGPSHACRYGGLKLLALPIRCVNYVKESVQKQKPSKWTVTFMCFYISNVPMWILFAPAREFRTKCVESDSSNFSRLLIFEVVGTVFVVET